MLDHLSIEPSAQLTIGRSCPSPSRLRLKSLILNLQYFIVNYTLVYVKVIDT